MNDIDDKLNDILYDFWVECIAERERNEPVRDKIKALFKNGVCADCVKHNTSTEHGACKSYCFFLGIKINFPQSQSCNDFEPR